MLVKIWSQDHRIKKLVSVSDFEDLKKKSVEEGVCSPGSNLKVFLMDGTEVSEASFRCLLQSPLGELNHVFLVASANSDVSNAERPSTSSTYGSTPSQFLNHLSVPWTSLPTEVLTALNSSTALKATEHQELVRMIATAMCKVAPRPTAKEIRAVASHIGEKYPLALRDPVATSSGGSTFHGLAHKIECRIVNARRGCKRLAVELAGGATKRATVRTTYGCTEWQPPVESINKDECESVKKILAAENLKAQEEQDIEIQDDLMKAVYPAMRLTINTLNNRASDIRREWPLLFTRHHFLAHFKRLTSTDLEGLFTEKRVVDLELLHAFLRHHVKTDKALQWLAMTERAAQEQNRPAALLTGLFPMLCLFFKEKTTFLFRTLEASVDIAEVMDTIPSTPMVLALGRGIFDCTCVLTVDGTRCFEGVSFLSAMELLYASYYCLNVKYPAELPATLEFIQRQLVEMNPEEGSRQSSRKVALVHPKVQGALQELSKFQKKWKENSALV